MNIKVCPAQPSHCPAPAGKRVSRVVVPVWVSVTLTRSHWARRSAWSRVPYRPPAPPPVLPWSGPLYRSIVPVGPDASLTLPLLPLPGSSTTSASTLATGGATGSAAAGAAAGVRPLLLPLLLALLLELPPPLLLLLLLLLLLPGTA